MRGTFYVDSDVSRLIICVYSLDDNNLELMGGSFWFKETNWTLSRNDANPIGYLFTFVSPEEVTVYVADSSSNSIHSQEILLRDEGLAG